VKRRRLALVLVVLGLAGLSWFLQNDPPPAPGPVIAVPQLPVQAPVPDAKDAATDEAPVWLPPRPMKLDDAFCSWTGSDKFELRYSLGRLMEDWLNNHPDGGSRDAQAIFLFHTLTQPQGAQRQALAREGASRWPDSVYAQVTLAIAGPADERVGALRRARQLAPNDPAIGWALADATRDSGDLDEAIDGLATYLAHAQVPEVARLMARLEVARDIQRGYQRETRDGVTLLWPPSVTAQQADQIAGAVDRALDDAAALTRTQRRRSLTVVVYPSRSELLAVSCARSWAGGLYDGTLRLVATSTPDAVDLRALRHESMHAQLTPVAPSAPKWFHEGVAQSFAPEAGSRRAWRLMLRNHTWVPFTSLDGSFQVFEADNDAELAYGQAFAMVELMRELGGDASISVAMAAFQSGADTPTALARACGRSTVTGEDLLAFLARRLPEPVK
jgi:hypothetical protein